MKIEEDPQIQQDSDFLFHKLFHSNKINIVQENHVLKD